LVETRLQKLSEIEVDITRCLPFPSYVRHISARNTDWLPTLIYCYLGTRPRR